MRVSILNGDRPKALLEFPHAVFPNETIAKFAKIERAGGFKGLFGALCGRTADHCKGGHPRCGIGRDEIDHHVGGKMARNKGLWTRSHRGADCFTALQQLLWLHWPRQYSLLDETIGHSVGVAPVKRTQIHVNQALTS